MVSSSNLPIRQRVPSPLLLLQLQLRLPLKYVFYFCFLLFFTFLFGRFLYDCMIALRPYTCQAVVIFFCDFKVISLVLYYFIALILCNLNVFYTDMLRNFSFFLKFVLFNIATAYHIYHRTKQSEQVCFILPKSIKLLETCYALRIRCTLL